MKLSALVILGIGSYYAYRFSQTDQGQAVINVLKGRGTVYNVALVPPPILNLAVGQGGVLISRVAFKGSTALRIGRNEG